MIKDTMEKIEKKITNSVHITDENKTEYLAMLKTLRSEVEDLSHTQKDQAETISGFAGVSAHEATREDINKDMLDLSIDGLQQSVQGLQATNPRLVSIVNSVCSFLSNIGI